MPLDLDQLIKLNNQEIAAERAKADIAGSMVDTAGKIIGLDLAREQVIKAHLENVAEFLDIQWDTQAHKNLINTRNTALQDARSLRTKAETLNRSIRNVSYLLNGGSWESIRDGWLGFMYLQAHLGVLIAIRTSTIAVSPEAYNPNNWKHPNHGVVVGTPDRDVAGLLQYARIRTYYPKLGTPAADLLIDYLKIIAEVAAIQAASLKVTIEEAQKSAIEIQKIDWDRLKPNHRENG